MGRNVEIKARRVHPGAQREKVEALADRGPETLRQEDTFFRCARGRLKLRKFSESEGELIHYERPDALDPQESRYVICRTAEPGRLAGLLSAALGVLGVVRKTRTLFHVGPTRVHLDEVEGLGDFLELEVVLTPDQTPQEGVAVAHRLMERIGVRREDLVAGAYIDMLVRQEMP